MNKLSIWDLYLRVESASKFAINDHIFLKGHDGAYGSFCLLLNESNVFKLQLKESLITKKDQSELNRNICGYLSELLG